MGFLKAVLVVSRSILIPRACLATENLALRQQLAVYRQSIKRPKLRPRDSLFWACLSQLWPSWRDALAIVQPETVIKRTLESIRDIVLRLARETGWGYDSSSANLSAVGA